MEAHIPLQLQLPAHFRCAAHALNLIASIDITKGQKTRECTHLRSSITKCSALWNRVSRSTQAHETATNLCERALTLPNDTRWSSLFNALLFTRNRFETVRSYL